MTNFKTKPKKTASMSNRHRGSADTSLRAEGQGVVSPELRTGIRDADRQGIIAKGMSLLTHPRAKRAIPQAISNRMRNRIATCRTITL
jgi:hypothetical protein